MKFLQDVQGGEKLEHHKKATEAGLLGMSLSSCRCVLRIVFTSACKCVLEFGLGLAFEKTRLLEGMQVLSSRIRVEKPLSSPALAFVCGLAT